MYPRHTPKGIQDAVMNLWATFSTALQSRSTFHVSCCLGDTPPIQQQDTPTLGLKVIMNLITQLVRGPIS
jgi:hypothetical protein